MNIVIFLAAFSILFEITMLSKMVDVSAEVYTYVHLLEVLILLTYSIFLYIKNKDSILAIFAIGMLFTTAGDYVNCHISPFQPVYQKLKLAIWMFGIGYSLYTWVLWKLVEKYMKEVTFLYLLISIVVIEIAAFSNWIKYVYPDIQGDTFYLIGTSVITYVIYTLMPVFAFWYFVKTKFSIEGAILLIGCIFISYSDAVIFHSWLKGNLIVPSPEQYQLNWILYFTGQSLMMLLPIKWIETKSIN